MEFKDKEVGMRFAVAVAVVVAVFLGAPVPAVASEWVWPVEGRVLTHYSNDNGRPYAGGMHRGIDIAAVTGTSVVAARAGTVTHAGVVGSSGLTVSVRTTDGRYLTSFLHLSDAAVKAGDSLAAGARLGAVGTSGRRSVAEPHLHFGVRLADREDQYVDPLSLLPGLSAPAVTPPAPVPAPVPLRAAPRPVPVAVRGPAPATGPTPLRPRPRPVAAPVPARPHGALAPGPAAVPRVRPAPAGAQPGGHAAPAAPAPAGPAARRARDPAPPPRVAASHGPSPSPDSGPGRSLVLAGLGAIALVLFGGLAWRALASAHAGVNARSAALARAVCDRARIPSRLRRLPLPRAASTNAGRTRV